MKERETYGLKADVVRLQNELRKFFEDKGYRVGVVSESSGTGATIRANKNVWGLPDWTGAGCAITVKFSTRNVETDVKVYDQKWVDKIIIIGLGTLASGLFIPVLLLPIAGTAAYQQYKLTQSVWEVVDLHMRGISDD